MPGTDMSLDQLAKYRGSYPAPEDFFDFWHRRLEEIKAGKLCITEEVQPFIQKNVVCSKISITAGDGVVLRAKYVRPAKNGWSKLMVQFHDYPGASRSWFHLCRYAAVGFAVLAPDCRGQGGESGAGISGKGPTAYGPLFHGMDDTLAHMYLCHLFEDAFLWLDAARQMRVADNGAYNTAGTDAGEKEIDVYGEGQGAALAIACGAMYPKIRKCAAHYPMLCDYYRVWEKDFDVNAYEGLGYYFRWRDPLHRREKEIFDRLAYFDVKNFAPAVRAETLVSTGLQDIVSPPSAQFAVVNNLRCKKHHLVYPKHGHELNNFFENELLKFLLAQ